MLELKGAVSISGDFETGKAYALTVSADGDVSGDLGTFSKEQRSPMTVVGDGGVQWWGDTGEPAISMRNVMVTSLAAARLHP